MDNNILKVIINKNLILKNVDPTKVLKNVLENKLMVMTKKITININEIIPDVMIGPNCEYEVYEHINNSNKKIRTFTINHKPYNAMMESMKKEGCYKESYMKDLGLTCDWCRQSFNCIPWQIPIKMCNDDDNSFIFYGDGIYCSNNCMYAHYKELYDNKLTSKDSLYIETYGLIKFLCILRNEEFPIAAPHWKLLHSNGGPLNDIDFYKNKNIYHSVPNIVMLPCKRQYSILK